MDNAKLKWIVEELYSHQDNRFRKWPFTLYTVMMVGFLLVGFNYFPLPSFVLPRTLIPIQDSERWEFVAITYTMSFSILVYFILAFHLYSSGKASPLILFIVLPLIAALGFMYASISALQSFIEYGRNREHEGIYLRYLLYVWLASIAFLAVDWLLAETDVTVGATQQYAVARIFADLPMVVSLTILLVFARFFRSDDSVIDGSYRHFIGGALAFQMWVSNVVFIIVVSNMFWPLFFRACINCEQSKSKR